MSNRKNSEFKKRLADLRINEPLRLSKPNYPTQTEVPHSKTPCAVLPKSEAAHKEGTRDEITQIAHPHNGLSQTAVAQIEVPGNVLSPIENTCFEVPQIEQTQNEKAHSASQGFFKLSHAVFLQPLLRELSGDCFRLFLWLSCRAWRFPDSDGTVRASVGYMESHIGMGHATISRGLRALKETGLVSLEEVNFKRGNLWRIVPLALGTFDPENSPTRFKEPQKEAPKIRSEAASKLGGGSLSLSKKLPQIEQQIININKQKISEESAFDPTQFEAALTEFESNVPQGKRQTITQEFTDREFPHGILPPALVIKKLVAMEWYTRQNPAVFGRVG